jgi:hypothetical protein
VSTLEAPVTSTPQAAPKRRTQRLMQAKFPYSMNFGITGAMFEAIQDMCTSASPFTQSDVGRLSLHAYLLTNSERYRRAIAADGMKAGRPNA